MRPAAVVAGGLGAEAARVALALLAVCLLAAVVLWLLRRRMGVGGGRSAALRVVARLSLEPGRTLFVVDAAGRFLLVGVGDGPMALLAELGPEEARRIAGGQEVEGRAVGPVERWLRARARSG